jgi:hypothetical protein
VSISEFERLLEALIPLTGRTTLTLTQTPESADCLIRLLEKAIATGNRRGAPLSQIDLPVDSFETFGSSFWHVPVEDSSRDGVVRLTFEAQSLSSETTAAAA